MPGGDGTGPGGMGPMTGRAAGYCAGYPTPGYMNPIGGRAYGGYGRFGRGRGGGGRGRRNWFYATGLTGWQRAGMGWGAYGVPPAYPPPSAGPFGAPATKEQELDALKDQAEHLQDALEGIRKRVEEIQSQGAENAE